MTPDDQILSELQKINQNLDQLNSKTNPVKNSLNNFLAGFFHSFGNLVGTIVIFFALIFIASRFNLTQILLRSFEQMMSQVNWSKIIPTPKIQIGPGTL